ncbi:Type I restriction-modification system, specificity subunit S [Bacillus cereus F837/76]|uniref:restriction endonuclease subunit S n=1 Tax=Bacillus cereus TaxID=1396 RepID=UPI000241E942|nr:restriction endonuclease subunit S [Bacillus cereus]AEW57572.1 Type I restriction-modification system, specificity subunit S [Bacillus cereus F837/76]
MKNKRTPDIRFPGFTGEWEKCNLGNISTKIGSGKTPKGGNQNYKSEGIPLLRSQNIFNDKVNFNDVVYITPEIDEDMANSRVQKGDVLLNITGASIGRSAVYELNHKANVNQHVSIIRPSGEVNPYFIQLNITSEKGQKQIELNQAGGGREGLNFQQIAKMGFYFPALVEQGKIGDFFIQLDNTITLHQQELTTLKQAKQGFLQKMFPKEGESAPEVRFSGFTGDWNEHKLCDVADMFDNSRIPVTASKRIKGTTPYYGANGVQDYVEGFTHDGEFVLVAEDGANDLINYPVNYVNGKVWVNNHAHVISGRKSILNNLFLVARIKCMNISTYLVGGGRAKLNGETLKKIPITIPSFKEQTKIGDFFKQLDDTIALHQRELDALKETKKAFLHKMFV